MITPFSWFDGTAKVSTLQAWRLNGKGPSFVKFGSAVRYRRDDVDTYIEHSRVPGDRVQ